MNTDTWSVEEWWKSHRNPYFDVGWVASYPFLILCLTWICGLTLDSLSCYVRCSQAVLSQVLRPWASWLCDQYHLKNCKPLCIHCPDFNLLSVHMKQMTLKNLNSGQETHLFHSSIFDFGTSLKWGESWIIRTEFYFENPMTLSLCMYQHRYNEEYRKWSWQYFLPGFERLCLLHLRELCCLDFYPCSFPLLWRRRGSFGKLDVA